MTADRWLTLAEAAERVGRTSRSIRAWVQAGHLKPMLGRVRESELIAAEKLMRSRMHGGRPKRSDSPP